MLHLLGAIVPVPYPSWLNPGDNTWQMTAATFVGLMSLPGLAVLYASIVPKKWAVNVLAMMFAGFSLVLIAWVLWSYKMGFGATSLGGGVHERGADPAHRRGVGGNTSSRTSSGKPGRSPTAPVNRARRCRRPTPSSPSTSRPTSLAYFQFVFAAITPLLFLGSVLGRIKFSAWCLLVPLWSTFVYGVDAFLLWGGGYFAQEGALDFSGGYVIHMSAGVSGLRGRLGPRAPAAARSTDTPCPTTWSWRPSVPASCGSAGTASTVVTRTTPGPTRPPPWSTPTWPPRSACWSGWRMDAWLSKAKKPTFLGGVNGMICGLVGITPCAGWVNGWGAIVVGRHLHAPSCGSPGTTCPRCGRSPRWTMPSGSSTPTASPASSAACCWASSATRTCSSTGAAT